MDISRPVEWTRNLRAPARLRSRTRALSLLLVLAATLLLHGQHTRDTDGEITVEPPQPPASGAPAANDVRPRHARLREGTEIRDVPGRIHLVENRFEFASRDGQLRLKLLENLALERAARKSGESAQAIAWKVSGVITEFENGNYLLVRRIVVDDGGE